MTKSPRAVAREALRSAREALPTYSSPFSRQGYTQHQHFALLVLKTDYRGAVQAVADFAEWRPISG